MLATTAYFESYRHAMQFVKTAQGQRGTNRITRTYSNSVMPRQVDPALQIGGPGQNKMTAEFGDQRIEQAYRQLLRQHNISSPPNEMVFNNLVMKASRSVYGPPQEWK